MHLIDQQLNLMIRGRFDEAWQISQNLEDQNPSDLRHRFNRGWFLIQQGKLQEGFQSLESGRFLNVYGAGKIPTTKPIWDQSCSLLGKTVILNLECGFGDQIIYARFATEIQKLGGTCILCCDPNLASIFSRIPGVSRIITLSEVPTTYHDYWIPGFSASWLFGHEFDTLPNQPYLSANPASVEIWKSMLGQRNKPRIGIRWSGSPRFEHQQFRIFPPEKLINLHQYSELQFYSLQRDDDTRELPEDISDLKHLIISWEDTAACIENLDLVITSCTSVAHLSAALGKPTWVVVPILPYHIWAYGDDYSPWYPRTTRIFRQTKFSDWTECFDKLESELAKYFDIDRK
jgi:ADP-heptose:LPS heptosyltransferase